MLEIYYSFGATGYLGSHIAYEFLTHNKGDLYLLVRIKNNISTRQRILNVFKFYFGDEFVQKFSDRIKVVTRRYCF